MPLGDLLLANNALTFKESEGPILYAVFLKLNLLGFLGFFACGRFPSPVGLA